MSAAAAGVGAASAVAGGNNAIYDVMVNSIAGTGTVRLDLKAAATGIADLATNPIGAGFTGGESYSLVALPVITSALVAGGVYNEAFSYTIVASNSPSK